MSEDEPIRVGISTCLLGKNVRYDGGHKRDRFLVEDLGPWVEWVAVCPEVEVGMGTPRPALRLVEDPERGEVRMVEIRSRQDHTRAMRTWARRRARALRKLELDGYVLKKDSPSCGLERVKVYTSGMPRRDGRGLFAEALVEALPELPVEEEGRLHDPALREGFIERLFAHRRLRQLFEGRWTVGDVVAFHTRHKFQLLAHAPGKLRELGRMVAAARDVPRAELRDRYRSVFAAAVARPATRGRNVNVLEHVLGYLRERLEPAARDVLAAEITDYGSGLVPLVVPIALVRHHARVLGDEPLLAQTYLSPHPKELMLRNRV